MTPAQCQAARGLLNWTQTELAKRSDVELRTIHKFEKGERTIKTITSKAIIAAFERAGAFFPPDVEGQSMNGVALRWGVNIDAIRKENSGKATSGEPPAGSNAAWDDETRESAIAYWQVEGRWDSLSEPSRALISNQLFGRPDAGDEVFGVTP
jgi:DNA-binding XRE family transcriptional regulator